MAKVDPWEMTQVKDYAKLVRDFGIRGFEDFQRRFEYLRYVRRGIIFGQRDFNLIVDAIDHGRPYAMMTGLMPSGCFHLGHKMVADEIIWFQGLGAQTYICAADVESYLMRDVQFDEAWETAIQDYLANYFALGLKKDNLHFWFQSDYVNPYYRLRDMASKRVTFNELKAIYGDLSPSKITSALTQVADILHPQLPEFGGPKPTVVPVGADQDPHIRLTRDIASRLNAKRGSRRDMRCVAPSATYHKFMSGLTGDKMSSSDPKTHISLTEQPKKAAKKVLSAKTGGRETVQLQRKKGGEPDKCVIYELYLYHLIDDEAELSRIYHECRSGKLLCGQDKKDCARLVERFLSKHQGNLEKARSRARKFIKKV